MIKQFFKINNKILVVMLIFALCIVLFCSCENKSENEDTEPEKEAVISIHEEMVAKATDIVNSLTLKEKIGQMIMPSARTWSDTGKSGTFEDMTVLNETLAAAISEYNLSGICLFSDNCENAEQVAKLTSDLQDAASKSSSNIPMFISIDQEGGYITRLTGGTNMIGSMALAATGDTENAKIEASVISGELSALCINVDFAPDSDINDNPENPVIGIRSYSDNADIVTKFAEKYIEGLHLNNVISCMKHFPGHGNTATDSHTGLPLVNKTLEALESEELIPFASIVKETDMIMTAHIQFPQIETETHTSISSGKEVNIPATMSKTIITGILREKLGYEGVVITDSFEMSAITKNFSINDAVKAAINADVDIILMPYNLTSEKQIKKLATLISDIEQMVSDGEIQESQIDDSVIRILTLKLERGIMTAEKSADDSRYIVKGTYDSTEKDISVVGSKENHATEWALANKAITLYQDLNNTYSMGIQDGEKVLYLYPTSQQSLCLDLALERLTEEGISIEEIKFTKVSYYNRTVSEIKKYINKADRIILVTQTSSLKALDAGNSSNKAAIFCYGVIEEAKKQNKEVDLISSRLPYDAPFYSGADVILLAYNPKGVITMPSEDGTDGNYGANISAAIASIITGRELTGTCPVNLEGINNQN